MMEKFSFIFGTSNEVHFCHPEFFQMSQKTQRKHKISKEIKYYIFLAGSLNSSSGDLASSPAALSTGHKVFRKFVNTFRLKLRLCWNSSTLKWNPFINI